MSSRKKYRTIITFKDYFEAFLKKQRQKVKEKIIWTFLLIEEVQQVPETYLKHIEGTDGLYEIRIQLASDIFRIFCFFDDGKLVVLANGFHVYFFVRRLPPAVFNCHMECPNNHRRWM